MGVTHRDSGNFVVSYQVVGGLGQITLNGEPITPLYPAMETRELYNELKSLVARHAMQQSHIFVNEILKRGRITKTKRKVKR